jgi:hypothetical protein
MKNNLTKQDYSKILTFYKLKIPKTKKQIKIKAENILNKKLCRCIKKIDPINEARSIGICTRAIFNKKGLTRGKFSCTEKKNKITVTKNIAKNITKKNKR